MHPLGGNLISGSIKLHSNDPERPDYEIVAEFYARNPFGPEQTGSNHSILLTAVEFDGDPVRPPWEIGVFTPGGVLCGAGLWMGEVEGLPVWGADDNHQDYFHDGEVMTFRGYDPRADQEYQLVADIEEGSLIWADEGLTILSLSNARHGQDFPLRQGWNLFSLNLIPSVEMREGAGWVDDMFSQLQRPNGGAHHVLLMKDQNGNFWRPASHFNNIPRWNPEQGYQICVDEAVYPEWFGVAIDPQADIPLRQGWNIVPYYPDYSLIASRASRNYVISPIIDYVLIAKDFLGNFMMPPRDYFSNMPPWHEGQAYQIKVSEAVLFNYPAQQQMQSAGIGIEDETPPLDVLNQHFNPVTRTGSNMSVLLTINDESVLTSLIPAQAGIHSAEIGAFSSTGLCVGSTALGGWAYLPVQIGMAVWGDDPSTEVIDGAIQGEALTFRFWDGKAERTISPAWEQYDGSKSLSYQTDSFASGIIGQTGMSDLPEQITLYPPSPNPFNSTTLIEYFLPENSEVILYITDLQGRQIETLASGHKSSGKHSVSWNPKEYSGGLYFVILQSSENYEVKKVTLIK